MTEAAKTAAFIAKVRQELPQLRIVETPRGPIFFDEYGREMVVFDD